jgi:type IV pilus assembly protein PilW
MTLVELTVAMAIGLFLIGGALFVYSQSRNSYRSGDSVSRLQESARFAIDTLEPDIRLARYWGLNVTPPAPAGVVVSCGGLDVTAFAIDFSRPADVRDETYDLPCPAFNDAPRAGSDVLILRHAEPWANGVEPPPTDGRIQLRSTMNEGQLFSDGVPPGFAATAQQIHNLSINAWYVSDESSFDDTLPSLRRRTLRGDGTLADEEVIPGVENLQVQLGVDTDNDGNVDRYVDGDHPLLTPGNPDFDATDTVLAVRVWMLVGTPADDNAWTDTNAYTSPDADLGDLQAGTDAYPARFRRVQVARTIFLNNGG